MTKKWTLLSLALALYGANSLAGTAGIALVGHPIWTGFYIGANAGYLWSANNLITNYGIPSYANQALLPISQLTSASLAFLGTNHFKKAANSFIGGGQIGYNALILDYLVIGIDADLDGLAQPKSTLKATNTVTVPVVGSNYNADIAITKQLDYLGLLKGRLGFLIKPTLLLYGSGAFAFGGASINTEYRVTNSASLFLPIRDGIVERDILGGWAVGGGAEWFWAQSWSVKAEYMYYSLGPMHSYVPLNQNLNTAPVTALASASVKTRAVLTENTVRLGVNYHFG